MRARLLALALAALLSAPAAAEIVDRVAAVVNKEVITLSEIYEMGSDFIEEAAIGEGPDGPARRDAELQVLDVLIQQQLVAQEMRRLGMDVTQDELERAIDDIARQNNLDRETLRREVERSGLPWTSYREQLELNIREMKFGQVVLQPRISITEDELRDLYNRRTRDLSGAESRSLQAIFLRWEPDATPDDKAAVAQKLADVKRRFAEGTPWETLVAEFPESVLASAGGELGTFKKGEAVAEIDGPSFSTPIGKLTDPIAVPTGMLVVRVASVQQGTAPPFDLVRPDLEQELLMGKMEQEMALWVQQARRQASVKVKLEAPR
ncbi:MAG: peptidyl-prolyl cis-trans isomerase [Alphaproteobacteria bacterium]|nr:peptidyl-prolyl cis-trans isomerase [Alphaproteobacteria bacterium]